MKIDQPKPDWWPECPWPANEHLKIAQIAQMMNIAFQEGRSSAMQSTLLNYGWKCAEIEILERLTREGLQRKYQLLLRDQADTDTTIRQLAKKVLSEKEVDGDSYCVPSVEDIVRTLVDAILRERGIEL